jgi:hypothetical protein
MARSNFSNTLAKIIACMSLSGKTGKENQAYKSVGEDSGFCQENKHNKGFTKHAKTWIFHARNSPTKSGILDPRGFSQEPLSDHPWGLQDKENWLKLQPPAAGDALGMAGELAVAGEAVAEVPMLPFQGRHQR